MKPKSSFYLKKWYFDVTTPDGRALICYAAHLHWHLFKVGYASFIYRDKDGKTFRESRFKETAEPKLTGDLIQWEDAKLGIQGNWKRLAPEVQCCLHESTEGNVDWHCHQPSAVASVQFKNEAPLQGYGYVECLEMSIPPWKMDFKELRWGRFAEAETTLIWIELRGGPNRQWVFDGQNLIQSARISEQAVELPEQNKVLRLESPVVLENTDKIRETVDLLLGWMPGIDRFTPLHFLQAQETKWCSKGTLEAAGKVEASAWAIHELVKI